MALPEAAATSSLRHWVPRAWMPSQHGVPGIKVVALQLPDAASNPERHSSLPSGGGAEGTLGVVGELGSTVILHLVNREGLQCLGSGAACNQASSRTIDTALEASNGL